MSSLKDRISFIIDNIYQATNAIGVSLLGLDNSVIMEIGTIDMELLARNLSFLFSSADNLSSLCNINNDHYTSVLIKKNNISILCVRLNKMFSLICVYAKEIDISNNLKDIEKIINNLIINLNDLKKQGE